MTERAVGLIAGLSVNAGIFYYQELARRHKDAGVPLDLLLAHADLGTVLSFVSGGDARGLARYFSVLIDRLKAGGCSAIAITAVAPHICIHELREVSESPIIDILSLIRDFISDSLPYERVAILGNKAVVQTNIYGSVDKSRVVTPPESIVEQIHMVYNDIALLGKRGSEEEYCLLEELAEELMGLGADALLLAGTDLSSFYKWRPAGYPCIDLAQLHLAAIANYTGAAQ
ncbi:MAG: aspartate/glutamate racemase family protein [Candidatus Eremiobacteraeota bacterium]|nr:aspartate/glutamate racemase family protein [Candidatus Eremiobacteraeota bacterium]